MARFYIGPDGNDSNNGLSRVNRIRTNTRLYQLIDGTAGPHEVCFEGRFDRDWANPSTFFTFNQANALGIRLRATAVVDGDAAAPLPVVCDYHRLLGAASAMQVGSTPVWQIATGLPAGNRVRRVFACDYKSPAVQNLELYELWEGGGASLAQCYNALGTRPDFHWTQYDSAGNLTQSLFVYCPVNPISLYGGISFVSDLSFALLVLRTDGCTVDPELVFQGGGYNSVIMQACQDVLFEAQIRGWHFYSNALFLSPSGVDPARAALNIRLAPLIQLGARSLPFYATDAAHPMGGHHGILIDHSLELNGLIVLDKSSNGRATRFEDCIHAAIGNYPPVSGKQHRNIKVERNVAFDFKNVIYGRAYGIGGLDTRVENVEVGGVITNQPTRSQLSGKNIRCVGGVMSAGKPDGGVIPLRFGGTTNKTNTAQGLSFFTSSALDLNDIAVTDWTFDGCLSGGLSFAQSSAT